MFKKLKGLVSSRRFWASAAGCVVLGAADSLGLDREQARWLAGLIGAWVVGDSLRASGD